MSPSPAAAPRNGTATIRVVELTATPAPKAVATPRKRVRPGSTAQMAASGIILLHL